MRVRINISTKFCLLISSALFSSNGCFIQYYVYDKGPIVQQDRLEIVFVLQERSIVSLYVCSPG